MPGEATLQALAQAEVNRLALILLIVVVIGTVMVILAMIPLIRQGNRERARFTDALIGIQGLLAKNEARAEEHVGEVKEFREAMDRHFESLYVRLDKLPADIQRLILEGRRPRFWERLVG
jgi:hypothetical protein